MAKAKPSEIVWRWYCFANDHGDNPKWFLGCWKFKVTPKRLTIIEENDPRFRQAQQAVRYATYIDPSDQRLQPTKADAILYRHRSLSEGVRNAEIRLKSATQELEDFEQFVRQVNESDS